MLLVDEFPSTDGIIGKRSESIYPLNIVPSDFESLEIYKREVIAMSQKCVSTSPGTSEQVSDEERNKYVARILEFSLLKTKQLAARAFQEDLIGKLPGVVERETLMQSGHLLDASARIYSFRVDATHTTVYEVRSKLGDESKNRSLSVASNVSGSPTGDGRRYGRGVEDNETVEGEDGDNNTTTSSSDGVRTDKRKNFVEYSDDDLPTNYMLPSQDINSLEADAEAFLQKYTDQRKMVLKRAEMRRAKVNTLIREPNDLNADCSSSCNDHLYCKATRNFDEGSCTGLLMQNALVCDNGRKILLHNRPDVHRYSNDTRAELEDLQTLDDVVEVVTARHGHTTVNLTRLLNDDDSHSQPGSSSPTADHSTHDNIVGRRLLFDDSTYLRLFRWRVNMQNFYKLTTEEMVCLLKSTLAKSSDVDRDEVLALLFPSGLDHTKKSGSKVESNNAKKLLEESRLVGMQQFLFIFEQTLDWILFSKRLDSMLQNDKFTADCSSPVELPDHHFFFARDIEGNSSCKNYGKLSKSSKVLIGKVQEFAVEELLKQLWQILDKADVNRERSLFKSMDMKDLSESITALSTSIAADSLVESNEVGCLLETISEEGNCIDALIDKTIMMTDIQEVPGSDIRKVTGNVEDVGGEEVRNFEDTLKQALEIPVNDKTDTTGGSNLTSQPDSNCSRTEVVSQLALDFCGDDSHWSGRLEKDPDSRGEEVKKATTERKRKKMSAHKKVSRGDFIFDDTDDFPLDVLKSKLKKTQVPKMKEETVLCIRNGKNRNFKFTSDLFKQFSFMNNEDKAFIEDSLFTKILVEDWCNYGSERLTCEENSNLLSNRSPCFLSLFNGMFEPEAISEDGDFQSEHYSASNGDVPLSSTDEVDVVDLNHTGGQSIERTEIDDTQKFFTNCTVRQRRINAQAVKRAIGSVLSNRNLDVSALKHDISVAEISMTSTDGKTVEQAPSDGGARRSFLNLSAKEIQLQFREEEEIVEDPTQDVHNVDTLVEKICIQGTHTFSSVLAYVPDFLVGRTAEDINPVDIFCIFLHLCNENNFEVVQHHDDQGLILMTELEDFTIINSRNSGNPLKRKRCD